MHVPPPSPRADAWEWAQAGLLVANLVWTTGANGGYGAGIAEVTLLLTGALVVVHALANATREGAGRRLHPAGWLLLPFLVYALANVLWVTPVRWLGWFDWLGWAQMSAVFWVGLNGLRSRRPRQLLFYSLVALGILGVLFGCYQRFVQPEWRPVGTARSAAFVSRASGSFGIPNSFAGFLLLILPAVAALTFRRRASATERVWWGWVGVVLAFGLILTLSRGAWLALLLALPVWPLLAARGGWGRRAAWAGAVLLALLVTGAVVVMKFPKAGDRVSRLVHDGGEITRPIIWRGAWRLFLDAPAFGTGAGSYNVLFERHRPERFRDEPMWVHNEYLNTLSDYGAVGFLLFFGGAGAIVAGCFLRRGEPPAVAPPASRGAGLGGEAAAGVDVGTLGRPEGLESMPRPLVPGGGQPRPGAERRREVLASPFVVAGLGTGVLAFALQMAVDFHLKIPALALAAAVVAALAVGGAWPAGVRAAPVGLIPRVAWLVGAVAALFIFWFFLRPMFHAEALRESAREALDRLAMLEPENTNHRRTLPGARVALQRATEIDPQNAQAWADLSNATCLYAFVEPARTAELGRQAEAAADRALRISTACPAFWIRRGVARDMQGRWQEAGDDFAAAVARAPGDATTWFFWAEHLLRKSAAREPGEAALRTCLRLDPWNPAGVSLRQRLATKPKSP